jgi:hypothetical protein
VIKAGSLWYSKHPLFIPISKFAAIGEQTTLLLLIELKARRFGDDFGMNYVEAFFLTEEGRIERAKFMNGKCDVWTAEFLRYCTLAKLSTDR